MPGKNETAVLARREAPTRTRGPEPEAFARAPCVLVEGRLTTYLHEDEPYAVRHWTGFSALVAIDDGRLVGVQFPSSP